MIPQCPIQKGHALVRIVKGAASPELLSPNRSIAELKHNLNLSNTVYKFFFASFIYSIDVIRQNNYIIFLKDNIINHIIKVNKKYIKKIISKVFLSILN